MRYLICALLLSFGYSTVHAQYTLIQEVNGVEFYTKWSHEKWWSKKSPDVLLIKVKNTNTLAVEFSLGVGFYEDTLLVQISRPEKYCLSQKTTANPRVKGFVYKPFEDTEEPTPLSALTVKLLGMEVEKQADFYCPKK